MMKRCRDCGISKPLSDYRFKSVDKVTGKRYPYSRCRDCLNAHKRETERERNRAYKASKYADPEYRTRLLEQQMTSRYGITYAERDAMLVVQDGCAICHTLEPKGRGWVVDHDHSCCPGIRSCGKCIRGILCTNCNILLGHAKDNPDRLLAAIEYLKETDMGSAPNAEPARVGTMASPQEHAPVNDGMPSGGQEGHLIDHSGVKEGIPTPVGGRRGNGALK